MIKNQIKAELDRLHLPYSDGGKEFIIGTDNPLHTREQLLAAGVESGRVHGFISAFLDQSFVTIDYGYSNPTS